MTKRLGLMMIAMLVVACGSQEVETPRTTEAPAAVAETLSEIADTVYTHGKIYTVNRAQPWAEAVAIKDGRFLVVGSNADVETVTGPGTKNHDLEGRFVMPGILDLHSHPFITPWYGSMNLPLQEPGDADAILAEVSAYAQANPGKEWIIGGQWSLGVFPDDNPGRELLDKVVPDRPVALLDQTGHSMWLNSRALELSGITAETPTSQLIVIEKDPTSGEPTGTIREQAIQLVEPVIPQATAEEYATPIEEVFEMFLSYGITAQQSAEGHRGPLNALKLLESQGRLEQRVFVSWDWKTTLNLAYSVEDIEEQIENRAAYATDLVYPNYVKIFGDGSPVARTSLLLEPYEGDPEFFGDANMTTEEYAEAFIKFDKMGVGVHIHVLGDGTARRVVDAFEIMKRKNGDTGVRHKVAHNFMTTKADLARLAQMKDVNVDFSPPAFGPHSAVNASFRPPIGDVRYQRSMRVKTALDLGLHVGQGSDWLTLNPTPNPFIALEGMVTRQNTFAYDPELAGAVNAADAVSIEQAIAICTLEGAWVLGAENDLGSIEVGKYADMILLDQNLFDIEAEQINDTQVLQTILGGEIVYDRSQ
jgi:predicted amidohydrolase YtcJ